MPESDRGVEIGKSRARQWC